MPEADPLQSGESRPLPPAYLRGFYDAEKRRKVVNQDPTWGQALAGATLMALPVAVIVFIVSRRRARAAEAVAQAAARGEKPPESSFMQSLRAGMQQAMQRTQDPMGHRDFRVTVKDTKFKDVIGIPEALAEVQQYVDFLRTPARFTRLGGRLPKGCLLTGQPGTGKTLLAKAVAGEADVPFFSCSGADFIEVYAGSGPKRVRELFAEAKKESPSVIFIDEIDAVGSRSGGGGAMGLSSEENRTINQLLAELDGLQGGDAVIVFAATNFQDSLDKALLREGRFDRKVEIPMPDKDARAELFAHYLRRVQTSDVEAQAARLASLTPGVSPATIAAIVNEGALAAAVADRPLVGAAELLPAIDDVLIGKRHRARMSEAAARRVALHESGHALVAWMLPQQSDVIKVSITPRGAAAGFTQQVGREVLDMPTQLSLFSDVCVMLGGRLAELTQHGTLTTGAQDDYQRATQTAVRQFLAFGMSPAVGLLAFEPQRLDEGRIAQKHTAQLQAAAEREAALLIAAADALVRELFRTHAGRLAALQAALYERKELLQEDVAAILGPRPAETPELPGPAREGLERFFKASEEAALKHGTARDRMIADAQAEAAGAAAAASS